MTLATMADRTLPLAKRVTAAYLVGIQVADGDENGQDALAALDSLRADVAAADRLARAAVMSKSAWGQGVDPRFMPPEVAADVGRARLEAADEMDAALDAYRARMAQGVARG